MGIRKAKIAAGKTVFNGKISTFCPPEPRQISPTAKAPAYVGRQHADVSPLAADNSYGEIRLVAFEFMFIIRKGIVT